TTSIIPNKRARVRGGAEAAARRLRACWTRACALPVAPALSRDLLGLGRDTQQIKRLAVTLSLEILVEQPVEHRPCGRHAREQGGAGFQLLIVGGVENLGRGAPLHAKGCLGTRM